MLIDISGDVSTPIISTANISDRAIDIAQIHDAEPWDRVMAHAPFPHITQSYGYGEGKAAEGWTVRRAVFSDSGKAIAIATVLERRLLGVRLAARVNRGPVFLNTSPSTEQIVAVYAAMRRRWRGPLLIAPALHLGAASDAMLRAAGYRLRREKGWVSARIDLLPDETQIWGGFSSVFRNRARRSCKLGATLRVSSTTESYEWMLARHADNMQDKQFKGPSAALLRAMRDASPENVTVFQLIHDDEPVAGMSVVRFGDCAEYHIGWFGPAGRTLNAGNFLMWEIVKHLKQSGVATFDLGGMASGDGYTRFKRTMQPNEFRLAGEWMSFY